MLSFADEERDILGNRIGRFVDRISGNLIISSISRGLAALIPIVLIGAFLTAALSLPIPAWQGFLNGEYAGFIGVTIAEAIQFATINIVSIAALFSVSYAISHRNTYVRKREIGVASLFLTALSSYILLTVTPGDTLIFAHPSGEGLLFALIAATGSERLFNLFFTIWYGRRSTVLTVHTRLRSAIRSILPMLLTLVVFALIRVFIMNRVFHGGDFETSIMPVINRLMNTDSVGAAALILLFIQLCWFFGLHGGFLIMINLPSVSSYSPEIAQHTILSREFFAVFATTGGAGMTLGLLLVLFLAGSRGRDKPLARLSLIPAVFNINETLTYGIPIIFNPVYFIPFIVSPIVSGLISYAAIVNGWVPHIVTETYWSVPAFYAGYVATGSVAGILLQVVCVAVSAVIYLPFVRLARRIAQEKQQLSFKKFQEAALEAAESESVSLLLRQDEVGELAQDFAAGMQERFENGNIPFRLVYQPKTDAQGRVMGAEALLRWDHPRFGPVSPVVLIEMGDEVGISTEIGRWVVRQATDQLADWREEGELKDIVLSVNLNPRHLRDDPEFCDYVITETDWKGIPRELLELEITEHNAIHAGADEAKILKDLKEAGFDLSIDDLGMGYSSLTYISDYGASVVKIDKSITDGILTDGKLREIVRSIVSLAGRLGLKVLVEGAESLEQVSVLENLGVQYYQGYAFSKPLSAEDFARYCAEHGCIK